MALGFEICREKNSWSSKCVWVESENAPSPMPPRPAFPLASIYTGTGGRWSRGKEEAGEERWCVAWRLLDVEIESLKWPRLFKSHPRCLMWQYRRIWSVRAERTGRPGCFLRKCFAGENRLKTKYRPMKTYVHWYICLAVRHLPCCTVCSSYYRGLVFQEAAMTGNILLTTQNASSQVKRRWVLPRSVHILLTWTFRPRSAVTYRYKMWYVSGSERSNQGAVIKM